MDLVIGLHTTLLGQNSRPILISLYRNKFSTEYNKKYTGLNFKIRIINSRTRKKKLKNSFSVIFYYLHHFPKRNRARPNFIWRKCDFCCNRRLLDLTYRRGISQDWRFFSCKMYYYMVPNDSTELFCTYSHVLYCSILITWRIIMECHCLSTSSSSLSYSKIPNSQVSQSLYSHLFCFSVLLEDWSFCK